MPIHRVAVLVLAGCLPQPEQNPFDPRHDWDADGFTEQQGDCDDEDDTRHPDAAEVCNGGDDDCDAQVDDDPIDVRSFFTDADGDGWGSGELLACDAPPESATQGGDCEDAVASVHPGAREVCGDGVDQDCDQQAPDCAVAGDLFANDAVARIPGMFAERVGLVAADGGGGLGHGHLVDEVARVTLFGGSSPVTVEIDGAPLGLGPRRTRAAAAGDATGDGTADVLAVFWSAYNEVGGSDLFLVPGPIGADRTVEGLVRLSTANGDALGTSTAAGDIDGDGLDDLLLGAPGWSQLAGAVFLVRGDEIPAAGEVLLDTPDGPDRIAGRAQGDDALGADLAVMGDADGDGLADALLATVGFDVYDGAEVYFVSGADLGFGFVDDLAAQNWHLGTRATTEEDGPAVTGLDDIDGDGAPDVVFSAPPDDFGLGATAWVIARVAEVDGTGDPDDDAYTRIVGDPLQSFGNDVASTSDLDGDGVPELVIGCERCVQGGAVDAGGAFVITGGALPYGGVLDVFAGDGVMATIHGTGTAEYRGASLASLGDVNGDGWPDLAVGSGLETPVAPDTWVFFGGPVP